MPDNILDFLRIIDGFYKFSVVNYLTVQGKTREIYHVRMMKWKNLRISPMKTEDIFCFEVHQDN